MILGDVNPALLNATALQNLADFVDQPAKGGSLVLIAGPSYMPAAFRDTPLARLLPFAVDRVRYPAETLTEGFVVQPTDLGLASPAMQLGDTPEETAAHLEESAAALLAAGSARGEAGRARAGRASDANRPRRPPPAGVPASSTSGPARCCSTPPTKPGAGVTAWATSISPAIGFRRSAISAARSWPTPAARPFSPPTAANTPRANRCGCGCGSPTSVSPRPKTTA